MLRSRAWKTPLIAKLAMIRSNSVRGTAALCLLAIALAGCATKNPRPQATTAAPPVPEKDKVLWQYRTALAALRKGNYEDAKSNLDAAIVRIGNILGKDEAARKARGYFQPEAKKTFIGEPYERAMAYYYRGILYWMDGEVDNARACFRSAQLEDSDAVDKKYSSDYVLLDYLDGFASLKMAGDGSDAFKRSTEVAKISAPPPYNPKANLLLFMDFSSGPTKYAGGRYNELLMFRHGPSQARSVQIQLAGQTYQVRPYDDLYYQATTRGGRVMDHILANKAAFKEGTDIGGDAALITGAVMTTTRQREAQYAGLGLVAAGIISKMVSASTTPTADVRSWDNLPLYLGFAALEVPPGQHTATVDFLDEHNRKISGFTKTVTFEIKPGTDKVVYVSDKS
jgi:tetratricopeptide (TPR) repeat protein